ncbi:hypothetical protein MIR68_002330 [Amoeboaphelidium protococcarum]|nr:hypothetical protein MIR68_002330 [Amoeboaphelidium protococcarum]
MLYGFILGSLTRFAGAALLASYLVVPLILAGELYEELFLLVLLLIVTGAVVQIHRHLWLLPIIICMQRRSLFLLALLQEYPSSSSTYLQPLVPQFRFIGIFGGSSSSFACGAAVYFYWRCCKSHPPLLIATGTVVYIHRYLWLALYHWLHVAPQSTFIGVTARVLLCFRSSYHLYYSHSFIGSTVESLDIRLQIPPFEFVKASLSALQSTVKSWLDLLGKSLSYYYIEMHCCCGSPHNRVCQKFCVGMACLQIL